MINDDFTKRTKLQDIGRWYVTAFVEKLSKDLDKGTQVLDAGAGECVYKKYFAHCDYKAIDLAVGENRWNYGNLDYIAPLHQMPIEDNTFDVVLCTQVLEHLEWPRESVAEMYRVLKPGGLLVITVPMSQGEHQVPYDFFRYTSYGLSSLCKHAGFKNIAIEPFGGLGVRWAYELPSISKLFPPSVLHNNKRSYVGLAFTPVRLLIRISIPSMQRMLLLLDRFDKTKNYPFGWSCKAIK